MQHKRTIFEFGAGEPGLFAVRILCFTCSLFVFRSCFRICNGSVDRTSWDARAGPSRAWPRARHELYVGFPVEFGMRRDFRGAKNNSVHLVSPLRATSVGPRTLAAHADGHALRLSTTDADLWNLGPLVARSAVASWAAVVRPRARTPPSHKSQRNVAGARIEPGETLGASCQLRAWERRILYMGCAQHVGTNIKYADAPWFRGAARVSCCCDSTPQSCSATLCNTRMECLHLPSGS